MAVSTTACATLREDATTILPKGRPFQVVDLYPAQFHFFGGIPDYHKYEEERWSTTVNAHPLSGKPAFGWPCST